MTRHHAPTALAALALATAFAAPAHATDITLSADGQWAPFSVDSFAAPSFGLGWIDDADGSALTFSFSVAAGFVAQLTVVDGAFAGDTFSVTNFSNVLGSTSAVPVGHYETAPNVGYDFDAALADPAFSRALFTLGAGSYQISGALGQSVLLGGEPLNATVGAVRLSVSAVPEPSSWALMLGGLALCCTLARRRAR